MAENLKNPSEREARVIEVGEYVLETGASTREAAEYFSKNKFKISNYTVSDYLKRYVQLYPNKKEEIEKRVKDNTPQTINDPTIRDRVVFAAKSCLEGYTMEEIADSLGVSTNVIYNDLHLRLPKIENINSYFDLEEDENIVSKVNETLSENSRRNLNNQKY